MNYYCALIGGLSMTFSVVFCADKAEQAHFIDQVYANRSGYNIAGDERDSITKQGGAPTYGEITFDAAQELFNTLNLQPQDVIYDLGSGVGKFIIQAYLTTPVKKAVGVELSTTRIDHARAVKQTLEQDQKLQKDRMLEFKQENIGDTDLSDATVVYMCSTCYCPELMRKITDNAAKTPYKDLRIVTLKPLPEGSDFVLDKELRLKMTWSDSTSVYIYKRRSK